MDFIILLSQFLVVVLIGTALLAAAIIGGNSIWDRIWDRAAKIRVQRWWNQRQREASVSNIQSEIELDHGTYDGVRAVRTTRDRLPLTPRPPDPDPRLREFTYQIANIIDDERRKSMRIHTRRWLIRLRNRTATAARYTALAAGFLLAAYALLAVTP